MSLPRMSLHIGDYRKDTGHLRAAGHGAYLLLIMHYWATGGLPNDDEQLAAIACMSKSEWKRWRPIIEKLFKPGWKHTRIEQELSVAAEKYDRRAAAGRKGGRPQKQSFSIAKPMPKQPITDNPKDGGGGDAGAREPSNIRPLVSQEAIELAEAIAGIAGVGTGASTPPGWCGAPMRAQAFLDGGWNPPTMLAEARATMAKKRDGPPSSITYFEKPFARAHAQQSAPLPLVEISTEPQTVHMRPANGIPRQNGHATSAITAAIDAQLERFERQARDDDEVRQTPTRLLSNG